MYKTFPVDSAIVRGLASTFEDALSLEPPPEPISAKVAHDQHIAYTELLRQIVPHLLEIPADDACPDCVFIEDTALVVNEGHAIISRPGAISRQPEPSPVAEVLRNRLGFPRVDVLAAPATLDGGDVQVLPWAVLVGTSKRTNPEAVAQLRALLADVGGPPVYDFSVTAAACEAAAAGAVAAHAAGSGSTLHFKSVLSALDPNTLLVADCPVGRALAGQIQTVPELASSLELIFVPDTIAANVLSIGQHVVMQAGFPASETIVQQLCTARGLTLHTLCMSELAKADGALTCCSLLFKAPQAASGAGELAAAAGVAVAQAAAAVVPNAGDAKGDGKVPPEEDSGPAAVAAE